MGVAGDDVVRLPGCPGAYARMLETKDLTESTPTHHDRATRLSLPLSIAPESVGGPSGTRSGHQWRHRGVGQRCAPAFFLGLRRATGGRCAGHLAVGARGPYPLLCTAQLAGRNTSRRRSGGDRHRRGPALRIVQRVLRCVCAARCGCLGARRDAYDHRRDECGCEPAAASGTRHGARVRALASECGIGCAARQHTAR